MIVFCSCKARMMLELRATLHAFSIVISRCPPWWWELWLHNSHYPATWGADDLLDISNISMFRSSKNKRTNLPQPNMLMLDRGKNSSMAYVVIYQLITWWIWTRIGRHVLFTPSHPIRSRGGGGGGNKCQTCGLDDVFLPDDLVSSLYI